MLKEKPMGDSGDISLEVISRCLNTLLESSGVSIEAEMSEAVIKLAGLTPREVRDVIDYGNGLDIIGDERYVSVDSYLSTLRERLLYAFETHDLKTEV